MLYPTELRGRVHHYFDGRHRPRDVILDTMPTLANPAASIKSQFMSNTFTAYIEFDAETGLYVGTIPGLAGGHSQGASLDQLQQNLKEVIELILEERRERGEPLDVEPFVGIQQITVAE